MTLAELIRKSREVGDMFNTYEIPLVDEEWNNVSFDLEIVKDDFGKYCIKVTQTS